MNRIKRTIALAVLTVSALTLFTPSASSRDMALGLGGGYASYNNGGYAAVNFQVDMARHLRLAPEVGYVFSSKKKSALLLSADIQCPFKMSRGFNLFPLAGLTFNSWSHNGNTDNRFGVDLGGGLELLMSANLKFSFQAKYSIMSHTDGLFAGAGIHFVF